MRFAFYILLTIPISLSAFSDDKKRPPIYLSVGESHKVTIDRNSTLHLRGSNFIAASEHQNLLLIRGKKMGKAEIEQRRAHDGETISRQDIFVLTPEQKSAAQQLQEAFANMQGLELSFNGQNLVVGGQLYRLKDWQVLYELNLTAKYIFHAHVDKDIQSEVRNWILKEVQNENLPNPSLLLNDKPRLILSDQYKISESQWRRLSDRLGLELDFQKSELALEPLVRIHIYVAEVSKKAESQIGISWPEQIEAQLTPKFSGTKEIAVFLKGLEQKGLAQILASPNLLAKSGSSAEFLAGGEFPIRIVTPHRREIAWKRHGISLNIKPRADRSGRLSVELSTEISLVDNSEQFEGLPGMKTNRMSTHFDLMQAQTIVLSGLIRHDWGTSRDGVVGFRQIPILGKLFESQNFRNQKSELIIFVTPELISENTNETPNMPDGWKNYESPN